MAESKRNQDRQNTKRPSTKKVKYFFVNDELHRHLFMNRGRDLLDAWNYPQGKSVTYTYSDIVRRRRPAFLTADVCKMVNRSRITVDLAIRSGHINMPQFTYGLNEHRRKFQYMWREEDVMELLDFLASLQRGRPRLDGRVTNTNLPTPRELRAMMNNEEVLYVRQGDVFVPSWKAKEFK